MNLAAEMTKLPEPPNDSRPPLWDAWRHDLWTRAQTENPRYFYRWPAVYHTMLVEHWYPVVMTTEVNHVVENTDYDEVVLKRTFTTDGAIAPDVHNLFHQAYHILRWQEATGQSIADMSSIYEFGGGYGAMALVCNRLGFKGQYYIYDLPEFALLQQWYLEECGVDNVTWVNKDSYRGVDLMIACYSLSETSFDERDRILEAWEANSYLFLYSNKFEQYDNIKYFQGGDLSDGWLNNWQHAKIEHLPPESWYTWGW
jgi:hypothetical protein